MLALVQETMPGAAAAATPGGLRAVSAFGVLVILAIGVAFSRDRRAIRPRLVAVGMLLQVVLGATFLWWETGNGLLRGLGQGVKGFLDLSQEGSQFLFNSLASFDDVSEAFGGPQKGFVFATMVLPTLIFFSSFMAVLYHLGIMQWVVRRMAALMTRLMGISGAESLSACGNVFVGQTEAPLLVRPYLGRMTRSELHAIMTGGFATIAGGVFVLYTGFGIDPGHLMVASVMAAPGGLVLSKILVPETEASETMGRAVATVRSDADNVVEAAARGAGDGLRLALNVAAMLVAFLGLVAVLDWLLAQAGGWRTGLYTHESLGIGRILGWLFSPVAAVMGVPFGEIAVLGELIGTKLALTELVAYERLGAMGDTVSPRTYMIATFALCGFANFGSMAIQIGGLGAIAPERRAELSRLALPAMLTGALATCMTACIAGVFG